MSSVEQPKILVAVIMGSKSDWDTMRHASEILTQFGVPHESRVLSAHRTPQATSEYASSAEQRGLEVIIAGAGGAAHLAGVIAAHTILPVLGVPMERDCWPSPFSPRIARICVKSCAPSAPSRVKRS